MALAIDDAVARDVPEIARLNRRVRRAALPGLRELHDERKDRAFFLSLLHGATVRVARDAERIAGFCVWRPGWIDHLYVDVDCHGRGIGSRLLAEAVTGRAEVRLRTFQRNAAARSFYARRGFAEIALTDGAANEEREPDVLLRWRAARA